MNSYDHKSFDGPQQPPSLKKQGINYDRPWRAAIGTANRGKSTKLGEKAYSLAGHDNGGGRSSNGNDNYDSDHNDNYFEKKPNTDGHPSEVNSSRDVKGRAAQNLKQVQGSKSTNIRIKRFKGEANGLKKGPHGQSLPDLSNRDITTGSNLKKKDYLQEMRLNRENGHAMSSKKRVNERTIE